MTEQQQTPNFNIQRIFLKDSSFESPSAPNIFRLAWEPKVNLDMNTSAVKLDENVYEITLMLTVTTKLKEEVAFIAEVKQAGIFTIAGFEDENLQQMLAAFAPNILFPYARTNVDQMIVQGSFPAVMLAPINFDGLYQQKKAKDAESKESAAKH